MATYYWLGTTGAGVSGNVNSLANWTIWSPNGACGFIPPTAATGPGLNDTVIFTRYNVSGACYGVNYYPQVAPLGVMLGRTGGGIQHFNSVQVLGDCPVPLGSSDSDFKFNSTTINFTTDPTSSLAANSQSYMNLGRGSAAYLYPQLSVYSPKAHTYNVKGTIRSLSTVTVSAVNNAVINMVNNATIEDSISLFQVSDAVPNSTTVNLISCNGTFTISDYKCRNSTINVYPGIDVVSPNKIILDRATLNFVQPGYSGEENSYPRTDINLETVSYTKDYPNINVNHFVSFENLKLNGGTINFNQLPSENPSSVTDGSMKVAVSRITAVAESVNLGSGGAFYLIGDGTTTTSYTPDIQLKGNWALTALPSTTGLSGY